MTADEDITPHKKFMIFGKDVSRMPCFRNSYLYGITGGLACGLAFFMFTSRSRMACHVGVSSFALITLGYWTQCRYKYSKTKFEMLQMQELVRHQNIFEGSQQERDLMSSTEDV